ncbi:MAG: Asp-tRNA(Asn)/Glu-tRNA(Gln) amidotransferase subunit GatA [Methanobacteriota archaeon]|nr:MAG: Asp-tRNA(Asn)/Glu-tRNA(Gln) amidotransferase subunit GatA [Euryarchaeota archaeon]
MSTTPTTRKKVEHYLKAIENSNINAFIEVYEDSLTFADAVDTQGGEAGSLRGMVMSVKNNIAIEGKRLTAASKMLSNYRAPYTATVVNALLREGAVIIGSANMDEFACGNDNTTSYFGPVKNPLDEERVPGGSSGGSAASVSASLCDASLGSDTGGSIRCPSAFTGVVGFKPSYGAVSRYGLADMAMSLDQIGPIAKTVEDVRKIYKVIRGADQRDTTTLNYVPNDNVEEPKLAVIKELVDASSPEIREAFEKSLASIDYDVISIPEIGEAVPTYYLNMFAEFSSAMQKYDGVRYGNVGDLGDDFQSGIAKIRANNLGKEVKRRIMLGTYITSKEYVDAWYKKALRARAVLKERLEKSLATYNALLSPTMPTLPWKIGEKSSPVESYAADISTVLANLAALPAGSIPNKNLPMSGIQVISSYGRDMQCLSVMEMLEKK